MGSPKMSFEIPHVIVYTNPRNWCCLLCIPVVNNPGFAIDGWSKAVEGGTRN